MKAKDTVKKIILLVLFCLVFTEPISSYAYVGSMGYEGGISSADPYEENTYTYREVCFLTGEPIILEGSMTVKKSVRNDKISTTYRYELQNIEQDASITRVVVMDIFPETTANGQTIENSKITRVPTEIVRVADTTFNLTSYKFSHSGITDPQPAVYYNAGEYSLIKSYRISSGGNITVEMTGNQYGYDQYWSSAKSGNTNVFISAEPEINGETTPWSGYADIFVSNVAKKGFQYVKNQPYQISFEGGYVQKDWEESVLEYKASLPEFDKDGNATDVLKNFDERMGIEPQAMTKRLMIPDLKHLEGHWVEKSIKILYSLGVIPGTGEDFNPAKYITRREFTTMLVRAVKEIPEDPDLINRTRRTTASRSRSSEPEISPFVDIATDDLFYEDIKAASDRGIIQGTGNAYFSPNRHITSAEAITMVIRSLGLEGLAPYPNAITPFLDNDDIPSYARNPLAVAYRIGLVEGDSRGYFHPNEYMTYEETADLLYKLIQYMGEELVKDYRERLLSY